MSVLYFVVGFYEYTLGPRFECIFNVRPSSVLVDVAVNDGHSPQDFLFGGPVENAIKIQAQSNA